MGGVRAVLAPLYAWWHFALAAAVSAAAWLGGRKLFPDKVLILPDPEPAPEREADETCRARKDPPAVERARALAELRRLDENIEDAKLYRPDCPHGGGHRTRSSTSWPGSRPSCPSFAGF